MSTAENVHYLPSRAPDRSESKRGPQVEDGYTRIANELYEAVMSAPLTLREMRVTMAVIRLTYGWNRKEARVTGGLLKSLTGMPATKASETLAGLVNKNVITRHGGSRSPVSLNKHTDQWQIEEPKRVTPSPKKSEIYQNGHPSPKGCDSHQIGNTEIYQNGNASKDRKDNTPSLRSGEVDRASKQSESVGSKTPVKKSPAKKSTAEYTDEFECAWSLYPKRSGSNPKREAFKCWNARLGEGFSPEDIIAGVQRYAAYIDAKGDSGTEYVMQGKRFFGKSAEFEGEFNLPAQRNNAPYRADGRKGFAQPKPVGSYGPGDDDLPDWAKGADQ